MLPATAPEISATAASSRFHTTVKYSRLRPRWIVAARVATISSPFALTLIRLASPHTQVRPPVNPWALRVPSGKDFLVEIAQLAASLSFLLASTHPQICLHERPQIAIQHAIHVADLQFRTVILDHPVRLQNILPDLRTEINVQFRILNLFRDLALLLQFEFVKLRAQHAHRLLFVLMLRPLILAIGHQARRDVRDPHRRIGRIDMLPTLAARTV